MLSFNLFSQLDEDMKDALVYAAKAHSGQTRSDNTPYIAHPERVAASVMKFKKSRNIDALVSAAYLHDTIEDTRTTKEDLEKMFGVLVASLVQELTSDKDEIEKVGKTNYLAQKMKKMSSYALVIKLADRLDNVQDIKTAKNAAWRDKYKKETLSVLNYIEKERLLSKTHMKIIAAIRHKLDELSH
jgi:guanosine-3',5'-bis(diphosphate) 3'-pyrophosphohydrolase